MIVALIELFVLPELYNMAAKGKTALTAVEVDSKARSLLWQVTKKVFSMPGNLIRSCIIGEIVAIIPGAGGNIANLVAARKSGLHLRGNDTQLLVMFLKMQLLGALPGRD